MAINSLFSCPQENTLNSQFSNSHQNDQGYFLEVQRRKERWDEFFFPPVALPFQ